MITEITEFLNSQLQFYEDHPLSPDGVADCSHLISPLEFITKNGRAVWSDQFGSLTDFIVTLLKEVFPTHLTKELLEDGVSTIGIFIAILLREVSELFPDIAIEEFLAISFSHDRIKEYKQEFSTTPYFNIDREKQKQVLCHPMFSQAIPITEAKLDGFYRRNIKLYEVTEETLMEDETERIEFEILDEEEIDDSDWHADPYNGFDEFHDYGSRRRAKEMEQEDE